MKAASTIVPHPSIIVPFATIVLFSRLCSPLPFLTLALALSTHYTCLAERFAALKQ